MGVATFNPNVFLGRYPEFTAAYNKSVAPSGSATLVTAILAGTPGTYIDAGVLALDVFGNIYSLTGAVTVGSNGTVVGVFANIATGAIPCPAGALSVIYQPLAGWDTVSNPAAGVLGSASMPWLFPNMFAEAGLYLNNTDCSIVQDVNLRTVLLNMLTAHIAFLGGILTADGQPRPVGRVTGASEGAVSAQFDYPAATPGSGPWFAQSQYGIAFWQATTCYRGARYFPQPTQVEGFTGNLLGNAGWRIR
jgi:hypothetical protein